MATSLDSSVEVLVLDSGAFISGASFLQWSPDIRYVTTPSVLQEIRDRRTRELIAALPFKIETLSPSPNSVKAVCDFSRKVGEYFELSATDIEILALAYQMEVEKNGTKNVRSEPRINGQNRPNKKVQTPSTESEKSNEIPQAEEDLNSQEVEFIQDISHNSTDVEREAEDIVATTTSQNENISQDPVGMEDSSEIPRDNISKGTREITNVLELPIPSDTVEESSISDARQSAPIISNPKEGDDSEGEWITSSNFQHVNFDAWAPSKKAQSYERAMANRQIKERTTVACITTDFSMQNVMIQMGLRLISVDGKRLRRVKQWALGCYGCNEITHDVSKEFCPACGGHFLVRVAVLLNSRGDKPTYHWYKSKKMTSRRGKQYSIPKPKGGRSANDIILREDDLERARQKLANGKKHQISDWFDQATDFSNVSSSDRSKGVGGAAKFGHERRNPNEMRKNFEKSRRKKKNRG